MQEEQTQAEGCYLYGFTRSQSSATESPGLPPGLPVGGAAPPVQIVNEGAVAALVSPFPADQRVTPLRRNLAPHYQVLRAAAERGAVVPVRFGHVARSAAAVRAALRVHQDELLEEIARLEGRVEMILKADLQVADPVAHLVAGDPELVVLRDSIFAPGRSPSQAERMELGRRFEGRLRDARAATEEVLLRGLDRLVVELRRREPAQRAMANLVDLALLVPRDEIPAFEERLRGLAAELPDEVLLTFSGPAAPFSFVDLRLTALDEAGEEPAWAS